MYFSGKDEDIDYRDGENVEIYIEAGDESGWLDLTKEKVEKLLKGFKEN